MDSVCTAMGGHHLCWSRLYAAASLELGFSFLALLGGFVNLRILVEANFLAFCWGWDGARLTAWKFFVWPLAIEVSVCASEGTFCHNAWSWNEFFATVASSSIINSSSSFLSLQIVHLWARRPLDTCAKAFGGCLGVSQLCRAFTAAFTALILLCFPKTLSPASSVNSRWSEQHWPHSVHKSDSHAMVTVQGWHMPCLVTARAERILPCWAFR